MKLIVAIFSFATLSISQFTAYCQQESKESEEDLKAEKLGIIAELSYFKSKAENELVKYFQIQNGGSYKNFQDGIGATYNDLKLLQDQVILQLIADIRDKKGLKVYRKINDLLLESEGRESDKEKENRVKSYIEAIKKEDAQVALLTDNITELIHEKEEEATIVHQVSFKSKRSSTQKHKSKSKEKTSSVAKCAPSSIQALTIQEDTLVIHKDQPKGVKKFIAKKAVTKEYIIEILSSLRFHSYDYLNSNFSLVSGRDDDFKERNVHPVSYAQQ